MSKFVFLIIISFNFSSPIMDDANGSENKESKTGVSSRSISGVMEAWDRNNSKIKSILYSSPDVHIYVHINSAMVYVC
jgi:hypothetical protein